MLGTILLTVLVLGIVLVIYVEYRSAQKYKKEREEKRKGRKAPPSRVGPVKKVKKEEKKAEPEPEVVPEKVEEEPIVAEEVIETKPEPEVVTEESKEKPAEKELPACDYPPFDHSRTVESLGLSEEDAKEFIGELINQIDTQLPLIEKELETADIHQLERLTHSIKGSATNLGTGGVSDLLTDFNTYLKEGTDMDIVKSYFECLQNYAQKLKDQYA